MLKLLYTIVSRIEEVVTKIIFCFLQWGRILLRLCYTKKRAVFIPGMEKKENCEGGEFKYDIFDIL
jgi:hypothetical protein